MVSGPARPAVSHAVSPAGLKPDPQPAGRRWIAADVSEDHQQLFLVDPFTGACGVVLDPTPAEAAAVAASPGKLAWLEPDRVMVRAMTPTADELSALLADDPDRDRRLWASWRVCEAAEDILFMIDIVSGDLGVVTNANEAEAEAVRDWPWTPWKWPSRVRILRNSPHAIDTIA